MRETHRSKQGRHRLSLGSTAGTALVLFLAAAFLSAAQDQDKDKSFALLLGTVFTEAGLSLPGVPVEVRREDESKTRWKATSDRRGEFAIRLPTEPATYVVSTHSKERENQSKTIKIEGKQEVTVFFRLALRPPEGKKP